MKTVWIAALVVACGTAVSANTINLSDTYSSFLAFGDSLTDDGKFDGTPFESGPPSLDGRFSNGITFAENIAQDFAVNANLAIGGATARAANESPLPPQFGTFGGQIATLAQQLANPLFNAALGDRPLISVLFGANDILQNIGFPDGPAPGPGNIEAGVGASAANAVEANIRAIHALDPKFNDFFVMNLPNLAQTPLFLNPGFGAGPLAPLAGLETVGFNNQLALNLNVLRGEGINIIEFDLDGFFQDLLGDAALLGIDTFNPCTFNLSNQNPANTCVFSPGAPDNSDITLADNFFFVDGIHPNRNVHAAFADAFRIAADVAPVPLPAGLPLLLAGIGAFGLARLRKAA